MHGNVDIKRLNVQKVCIGPGARQRTPRLEHRSLCSQCLNNCFLSTLALALWLSVSSPVSAYGELCRQSKLWRLALSFWLWSGSWVWCSCHTSRSRCRHSSHGV